MAILPADEDRQEAERLARLLLKAANGEEGEKGVIQRIARPGTRFLIEL